MPVSYWFLSDKFTHIFLDNAFPPTNHVARVCSACALVFNKNTCVNGLFEQHS